MKTKSDNYVVGISSGWWNIGKDQSLLGLGAKIGAFGATTGVQFNQIDLDTLPEFIEPNIKKYVSTIRRKLQIDVGLHGEVGNYVAFEEASRLQWEQCHERLIITTKGAIDMKLNYVNWHLSSTPIVQTDERNSLYLGYSTQVVAPNGKCFPEWIINDKTPGGEYLRKELSKAYFIVVEIPQNANLPPDLQEAVVDNPFLGRILKTVDNGNLGQAISGTPVFKSIPRIAASEFTKIFFKHKDKFPNARTYPTPIEGIQDENQLSNIIQSNMRQIASEKSKELDEIQNEYEKALERIVLAEILEVPFSKYALYYGQIEAYMRTGEYMILNKDPIWKGIVGEDYMKSPKDSKRAYIEKPIHFNAAVACKYIQYHLTLKDHRLNETFLDGKSVVEASEEGKVYICLECPQTDQGFEGISRLFHPLHAYYLVKEMNSPYVKQCIDFEQVMSQNVDLEHLFDDSKTNELKTIPLPKDFGTQVHLLHLGSPIPYFGKAHIPIALAERGVDYLYKWVYQLKIRGFKKGILIFERGSGRGGGQTQGHFQIFEYSVYMLRKLVEYLDQDVHPSKLPPEFYGMSVNNKDIYSRQLVTVRDHAWDPLEGLLKIPEEKHTFFGSGAVADGKQREWDRARFR